VARNRRPRHQGVVYGPVRPRQPGPEGGLLGRILGMLVVLGAVAVLGVAALNFVGSDRPGPGATPTSGAFSPSPSISPSPSPSPTPPPTPPPTPSPSPAPTPFAVSVQEGPGYVTFGTEADSDLRIVDPRAVFELGERLTLSAQLLEPAGSSELDIEVHKYDPATDSEELVAEFDVTPRVSSASTFMRRLRTDRALDGAGFYVVRYVRGTDVLSEGWFEVTEPS
jgi:hypothetical protein